MPRIDFSDAAIRSIKPPETGTADYWDSKFPAFGLRASRGGTKTFVLNIHKTRRAIGRYPIISLADARTEAKRILAEKTLGKTNPQAIMFERAREQFLAEKEQARRASTVADLKDRLERHFAFKCRLSEITHAEIVRRLSRIPTAREHNHALRVGKTFLTWAVNRRYLTENPIVGIKPRSTQSRSRVLSYAELQSIWLACDENALTSTEALNGSSFPRHFATIVKLLIMTGQRRGEIAALQFSWIKDDIVTLPSEVAKNGREHAFPLAPLAASVLKSVTKTEATHFLFPARGSSSTCFSGWSKSKAALDKACGVTDWTLHDLRRTYASTLASLGVAPHIIERLLNHITGTISGVAAIYNRYQFMPEMRAAVEKHEAHLSALFAPHK